MFLPITEKECIKLGWTQLDIIFVTGDAYIDSPYIGVALLGKLLVSKGYRVGVVSQPALNSDKDITCLGTPRLFWAVTAGNVDSMVANYTPLKKKRKTDDFTPGGINNRRPDRATVRYVNLIKQFDRAKKPVVIGGIEASLRRIAHYDYWSNRIKRSVLVDSKANILIYGMSEKSILEVCQKIEAKESLESVRGICYMSNEKRKDYIDLPDFETVVSDKDQFIQMMKIFYKNQDPVNSKGLIQQYDKRFLIHTPPQMLPSSEELDMYNELDFEYDVHPLIKREGKVRGIDTLKNSVTINRGCFGECNFCAISVHQGTTVVSRTMESIIREIEKIKKSVNFRGIINDLGGATANIYGYECEKKIKKGKCKNKRCIFPKVCEKLKVSHEPILNLLKKVRKINGIKKVFIRSGLRYDLILHDQKKGEEYLNELIKHHISGQMKIAPEHFDDKILTLMAKPSNIILEKFVKNFYQLTRKAGKKQFLTYYIIVSHPGCNIEKTKKLKKSLLKHLKTIPQQIQIYTPLPLTWSSVMYYTEKNPFTGEPVTVVKDLKTKALQKNILIKKLKR